jgi:hypothetical protein
MRGHSLKVNNRQETGEPTAVSVRESFPFVPNSEVMESCDGHVLMAAVGPNSQSGSYMANIQHIADSRREREIAIREEV